jgi:3'-phosphoadenosine 5'-phosphosulfate sulfotransferase (PAPS reductase)/FAD synthetase
MDIFTLRMRQAMDLEDKIRFSKKRIEEWVYHFGIDGCYVSFSGGKDSTVLLHLVRTLYPEIKAMFVDTGLEYPEIKQFVKTINNVDIIRPKKMFNQVIEDYGFPIVSKEVSECVEQARKALKTGKYTYRLQRLKGLLLDKDGNPSKYNHKKWEFLLEAPFKISNQCCNVMKKGPAHKYYKETGRVPMIGTLAEESRLRTQLYLKQGCNGFNNKIPTSNPLAFWTEQDILEYLVKFNVPYASVYGDIVQDEKGKYHTTGCQRTGCMFCGFGCHLEKTPNRFQKLKETHPKQYVYIINKLGFGAVLDYINVPY